MASRRLVILCVALLMLASSGPRAEAGLGPQNVLVVIDEAVPESVAIGEYYIQRRNIPACNVLRLNRPDLGSFQKTIDNLAKPIKEYLAAEGLEDQIDVIVLTRGIPYRVAGTPSSMASVLYSEDWQAWPGNCAIGKAALQNPYYKKTQRYDYNKKYRYRNIPLANRRIVMMLSGFTVEGAQTNIDSGVDSDETAPDGTIYMFSAPESSGQPRLTPRHNQIPPVRAQLMSLGIKSEHFVVRRESDASIYDKPDVMGYLTGATRVEVESNTFLPGAFADHLTSFGGDLLNRGGQMSILEFTDHGAAGSAGTVTEPCNFAQKFPHAWFYARYAMGFSLGEAVWMSVLQPWQTIFVGDPLAQPWAVRPVVEINSPPDGAFVSNSIQLNFRAFHPRGDGVSRVEVYLDGKLAEVAAELRPAAGNKVTLRVDDVEMTLTSDGSENGSRLLRLLLARMPAPQRALLSDPSPDGKAGYIQILARERGDAGNGVPYNISAEQGDGDFMGIAVRQDRSNLVGGIDADTEKEVLASQATGHVYLSVGPSDVTLKHKADTSKLSRGEHELMLVVYQGDAIETQGSVRQSFFRVIPGDVNQDGSVDLVDVEPFIGVLLGEDEDPMHVVSADVNEDGSVNLVDVEPFIKLLLP